MAETTRPDNSELWDLEQLAGARGLCEWMSDQFRPLVGETVAEVGAGIGTFTTRLLDGGAKHVLAVEPEPRCADELDRRFGSDQRVRVVRETLPESPALAELEGSCDLVLCQNVLEHIEDDATATTSMARALRPGGALMILVPANPRLYGTLDRQYGHFRRYDRARLRLTLAGAGLTLTDLYSFNALGIVGWWAKNRRPDASIDGRSLRAYEAMLKVWRPIEDRLKPPVGLSLIAKARRPG